MAEEDDPRKKTDREYARFNTAFMFCELFGHFEALRLECVTLVGSTGYFHFLIRHVL